MKNSFKLLSLAVVASLVLSSCARRMDSSSYVSSASTGLVYEGVILSARPVTINDSDTAGGQPGLGTLGGGLAGGIGGSQIGKGKGSAVGAVGGAVAGAVIGSLLEDRLKTQNGFEYIVKLSDGNMGAAPSESSRSYNVGGQKVSQKIQNSTSVGLTSRTISVVQGADVQYAVGSPVYVIYNDDRPRIVPRNSF